MFLRQSRPGCPAKPSMSSAPFQLLITGICFCEKANYDAWLFCSSMIVRQPFLELVIRSGPNAITTKSCQEAESTDHLQCYCLCPCFPFSCLHPASFLIIAIRLESPSQCQIPVTLARCLSDRPGAPPSPTLKFLHCCSWCHSHACSLHWHYRVSTESLLRWFPFNEYIAHFFTAL